MKYKTTFPHKVEVIENQWITMRDGVRLAARIWKPANSKTNPVPAILEYIPYRKRDRTRLRDDMNQTYFAGHGYAVIRADMRGSGDSEGVLTDEYIKQEQDDGLDILSWIAGQDWCDGNIGMIGISWGGFNGLQIAALQPPELKAIVTVCSSDDRYADDVHYMGGCLLGDNLSWASTMFAYNSDPPDPEIAGPGWKKLWLDRLEKSGLWVYNWLQHQRRDSYWKHGSVCEDFSRVRIPVLAVSGWADGYSNTVFRLMEHLNSPRMGLVGPWSHKYPHFGVPGPAIGFLQECIRWWDRWLKNKPNGIMEEPMLKVFMQDSVPPFTHYDERPGRWIGEESWPSANIREQVFSLAPRRLIDRPQKEQAAQLKIESPLRTGLYAGKWCSYSSPPDLPGDQREDDGGALVFDTEPLTGDLEILGSPVAILQVSVNKPVAMAAVRLSDVLPNGDITRVTYGLLNLTHRNSHEKPEMLEPGKKYTIKIRMNHVSQRFPAGHKVRLSLSTIYWPLAWPPPEPVELTVYLSESKLLLPLRRVPKDDPKLPEFDEPETAPPGDSKQLSPGGHDWKVERDLANNRATLIVRKDSGRVLLEEIELQYESKTREKYTIFNNDLDSVHGETLWEQEFSRGNWHTKTITKTVLTSDKEFFYINADLDAFEGEKRIFCHSWSRKIRRDLV